MADWYVRFWDRSGGTGFENLVAEFSVMNLTAEIRNSEVGSWSGEIAIAQKQRGSTTLGIPTGGNQASSIAPYRTNYQLWRQSSGSGKLISEGMVTSANLSFNRDTILFGGKDWLHYLQRRIYPFDPELYVAGAWTQWPRRWPDVRGTHGPRDFHDPNPIDVGLIVKELFLSIKYNPPTEIIVPATGPIRTIQWPGGAALTPGVPPFVQNIPELGITTKYVIYPGDQTSIFDHITKISEQTEKGFEFDIIPGSREFKIWSPRRNALSGAYPLYTFFPSSGDEADGAITGFDWQNDGPDGTFLVGLASGEHKVGAVWTDADNVSEFGRHDKVYDFGQLQNTDLITQMLKDQNDLHPQRKLDLQLFNPEFIPMGFYSGGRPRSLLGDRVSVQADFRPYRYISADFRINAVRWTVDGSTNESVDLELEMVYEP